MKLLLAPLCLFLGAISAIAGDRQPQSMTWKVEGLDREALVYLPSKSSSPAPVVFGFHGHGGSAKQAARSFHIHDLWPEAMVVYMHGIPTPGRLTDPEGKKNGWQHDAGENKDRDVKFFDAVLQTLREKYTVDDNRIYATGHSNGAAFTYVLWAARPEVFAAFAPSAGGSRGILTLKPKPAMLIAAENDELVKFKGQQLIMSAIRRINGCDDKGTDWAKGCRLYTSSKEAPLVTFIHPGTHKYPDEAPALIVRFFKEQTRKAPAQDSVRALRKAVTLYASFDKDVRADFGGGSLELSTRSNDPKEKGKFIFTKGFDPKVFRIGEGKVGKALEAMDVLPNNGRVFFPAKGNIGFKKGGWGGTVSCWINTDPDKLLKTQFCDPVQITERGATNGGIWFDFNSAKPRDMRMGMFPVIPTGQKGIQESDPAAPMVKVGPPGFKQGEWHHIAMVWHNFDTGKQDAEAVLYIDGKRIGDIKGRAIAMDWDIEKAGIYIAVSYIGLLDELAVFGIALNEAEVNLLYKQPGLLSGLR